MLDRAFKKFPRTPGLILHSDQGWQYQHVYYSSRLKEHGIIQSMSRKGNCYDNCIMETFFGRMKNEMFYNRNWNKTTLAEFIKTVDDYIVWYNKERIKNTLGGMSPIEYRQSLGLQV